MDFVELNEYVLNIAGEFISTNVDSIIRNMADTSGKKKSSPQVIEHWFYLRDIVTDAELIDSIGPIGLQRAYSIFSKKGGGVQTEGEIISKVATYCSEKLIPIYDRLVTNEGRRRAWPKHNFIVSWCRNDVPFAFEK
jgi:hypothetical protein